MKEIENFRFGAQNPLSRGQDPFRIWEELKWISCLMNG
jgi:hypothetical protein